MSELAAVLAIAPRRHAEDVAALLPGVALFDGFDADDLAGFAPAFKHVELGAGEILWRQATPYQGLYVLLRGEAQVCRKLPGERELELARLRPGDVMGEIPLLGGGTHSATVRALGPCSLLFLSRAEFDARTLAGEPSALQLKQRVVAIACDRLRRTHAALAKTLPGAAPNIGTLRVDAVPTALPPRAYVSRLPLFRGLDPDLVASVLDRGTALQVPRGHVVQHEGADPVGCYVTLNGAVEDVLRREEASLRVGFAGPGHAFGYLELLDGGTASVTSVARERCLLLRIEPDHFVTLQRGTHAHSSAFAAAIEADLVRSLEIAGRALSHMAAESTA